MNISDLPKISRKKSRKKSMDYELTPFKPKETSPKRKERPSGDHEGCEYKYNKP